MRNILLFAAILQTASCMAQDAGTWNHKGCAVVLTYDDGIDADLDRIAPALDSFGLKATFYVIGASQAVAGRLGEWRALAQHGHELGNHTLFHPCEGGRPGRDWVQGDNDLRRYTVKRAVDEIRVNNVLLQAIDGKTSRTFAYPCGDLRIGDTLFYDRLRKDFIGARGVTPVIQTIDKVDLDNIGCFSISGQTSEQLIGLVNEAMNKHALLVFLFHGVGGGHSINEDAGAHSRLLHFLKDHESGIWIAPMVDVAEYIRETRAPGVPSPGAIWLPGKTKGSLCSGPFVKIGL